MENNNRNSLTGLPNPAASDYKPNKRDEEINALLDRAFSENKDDSKGLKRDEEINSLLDTAFTPEKETHTSTESPETTPQAEPPKEDSFMSGFWDNYLGDTAERMGAGAMNFVGNVKGLMTKGSDLLYSPTDNKTVNKIVGSAVDVLAPINPIVRMMQMQNLAESLPLPEGADKFIDGSVEKAASPELRNRSNRYSGKTFVDLWKENDYTGAAGEIFLTASESLPQSLMAAFTSPAGLAVTGAAASNEKYDNLDANNTDMGDRKSTRLNSSH